MNLTTVAHQYTIARAIGAADSTFSDNLTTKGDFANMPDSAVDVNKSLTNQIIVNGLSFIFGGVTDNSEFTWKLYGWKNTNGPAELVADGTGIIGSQKMVKYPHNGVEVANVLWADTLVVSNEYWFKEVEATASGNNSVSKIWLDACGYRYWFVEIPTSDTNMCVYYGYF